MMHFDDPTAGPQLLVCINGESTDVTFTLPPGASWSRVVDTQSYWDLPQTLQTLSKPARLSSNVTLDSPEPVTGSYAAKARSIVIFEAK
jgi:glycogen operon protein